MTDVNNTFVQSLRLDLSIDASVLVVPRRTSLFHRWTRNLLWLVTLDPHLLLTQTCFLHLAATVPFRPLYFTQRRHVTDHPLHPQERLIQPVLRYQTRLLEVIHMPLKYMTGTCQLPSRSGNKRSVLGHDATQAIFGQIPSDLSRCPKVPELKRGFREYWVGRY